MLLKALLPFFLLRSVLASLLTPRDDACADTHLIIARASGEPQGPGIINSLAKLIQRDNPGTTKESVVYPATLNNYANSTSEGKIAMTRQLSDYFARCPDSKIVLLGYSQGALVELDMLCGGGGVEGLGPVTPPIDRALGDQVVAIISMGDPRNIINQSYNRGTSTIDGLYPRQQFQLCDYYANRIQGYCDMGDSRCASGISLLTHLSYTLKYNNAALAFVNQKLRETS